MRKIAILLMFTFIISSTMAEGKVFVLAFHTFLDKEKISSLLLNKSMFAELVSEIICNAKTKYEETYEKYEETIKYAFFPFSNI